MEHHAMIMIYHRVVFLFYRVLHFIGNYELCVKILICEKSGI